MSQLERSTSGQRDQWRVAAIGSAIFVALLWVIEIVDAILDHRLDGAGIRPREADGLDGILWAPMLHGGWGHLMGNTVPALILCFVVMMSGLGTWARSTAIIWVIAGFGTWLTGGDHSVHIGASSLIFGWVVYLVLRGFFHHDKTHILIGVVVFLVYGTMLLGVLPGQDGVSWQGHLFGAVGGAVAARLGDSWGRRGPAAVKEPKRGRSAMLPGTSSSGTSSPGARSTNDDLDIDALLRELDEG